MIRRRSMLAVLFGLTLAVALPGAVSAGIFSHKPKPSSQRATELIGILRSDPDEKKRTAAADELGSYDLKTYPEIVPPLLQALNDQSADVRHQTVQTLGKLRPVSPEIGQALEQTLANDSSSKVRMQARTTLWSYHIAGYRSPKNPAQDGGPMLPNQAKQPTQPMQPNQPTGPMISTTQEPPLADRAPAQFPVSPPAPPTPAPVRLVPAPVVQPAAPPKLQPPAPAVARPLPSGPSSPTQQPVLVTPPIEDLGPSLNSPK
jgi:hypothetical protein